MRILIADDCPINRLLLAKLLEQFGACDCFENGFDAFDAFLQAIDSDNPYKLLCLDLSMPEMNGYETLDAVRDAEKQRDIADDEAAKAIIVTAFSDETDILKSYRNCHGYIIKPICETKLIEKLAQLGIHPNQATGEADETTGTPQFADKPPSEEEGSSSIETSPQLAEMLPVIKENHGQIEFYTYSNLFELDGGALEQVTPEGLEFFKNILAGQAVARVSPGCSVLKIGTGISGPDKNGIISSVKSGRVQLSENTISVNDTLVINETVKLRDIDFIGKLEINGNVCDGVRIKALKGLKINGSARGCELRSGGDIEVTRVDGKGKALIVCGGHFSAEFLYDTQVECRKSAHISKESFKSTIKSSNSISAETVSGGKLVAFNSISVGRAGSHRDIDTLLAAGVDYFALDRQKLLESNLEEAEKLIKHIDQMLGPSEHVNTPPSPISESRKQKTAEFKAEKKRQLELINEYRDELSNNIAPSRKSGEEPFVTIRKTLNAGVTVEIENERVNFTEERQGEITITATNIQHLP